MLYARRERDFDSLNHTRIYSKDFGMPVRVEKCSRMVTKRRMVVRTEGITYQKATIAYNVDSYEEAARKAAPITYRQS